MKAVTSSTLALLLLLTSACSADSTSAESTTTVAPETTTTTVTAETTSTTVAPETTTTTLQEPEVPDPDATVLVYGAEVRSKVAQTGSVEGEGVTVVTLEYVDTIEMSDPRASGTAEWTAELYSPAGDGLGGTWTSEDATLTNEGGTWVGYRTGTYILTLYTPSAVTTKSGVITGAAHYIGQGTYEGLRMDLYTSSDGHIGTIRPLGEDTIDDPSLQEGVETTADTQVVQGSWIDSTSTETGSTVVDGVEVVTIEYSEVLEMSDPRVSGTMEYTSTLSVLEPGVGGSWVVEDVTLVNEGGTWVGGAMGAFAYTEQMPKALTTEDAVIIGEWHFLGTGSYDGLRLDIYNSTDGVIGTINPVN